MNELNKLLSLIMSALFFLVISTSAQNGNNWVDSKLYTYNEDGSWCWFQDERAVVDTNKNKLIIGSTNMQSSVDVVIFDIASKKVENSKRFGKLTYADDHNAPAVLVGPNGNYVAMWAHHYDSYNSHYSIYNGESWTSEKVFDWTKIPGGTDYTVAYSNLYYLSAERRMYNFARANSRAPNFIYSDDSGNNWKFGGQITTNNSNTYNKGYYKYWSNGVDRIDIVLTEQHPRDFTTSIYHGYIKDGKTYSTDSKVADDDIYDRNTIPSFDKFTKVFAHGTKVNGVTMGRCWQHDIARYHDGTIAILFKARANDKKEDHRNFYARYDGSQWSITYIGKAGQWIYGNEHDYVGLGALNPDDPDRIYICSAFNPGDDNVAPAAKREIWRGTTENKGKSWKWEPVTANSSEDNWRPIVPKWHPGKEALLWFCGRYETAQKVYTKVVGTFYEYGSTAAKTDIITSGAKSQEGLKIHHTSSDLYVTLQYTVPRRSSVALQIYTISGNKIATLVHKDIAAGIHTLDWNTIDIPSGIYLAKISFDSNSHVTQVAVHH